MEINGNEPIVFLSHTEADSDFADQLENQFRAKGLTSVIRVPQINQIQDFQSEPGTILVGFSRENISPGEIQRLQTFRNNGTAVYIVPSGVGISPVTDSTFNFVENSVRLYDPPQQEAVFANLAAQAVAVIEPLNPGHPFFISYAYENRHSATLLKNLCEENHILVWLAEKSLSAGDDWKAEIDNQISVAPAILLLISEDSMSSHYVTYEWSFGMGQGRDILPLLVNECANLHPKIEALHYIDFDDEKKVLDEIRKHI